MWCINSKIVINLRRNSCSLHQIKHKCQMSRTRCTATFPQNVSVCSSVDFQSLSTRCPDAFIPKWLLPAFAILPDQTVLSAEARLLQAGAGKIGPTKKKNTQQQKTPTPKNVWAYLDSRPPPCYILFNLEANCHGPDNNVLTSGNQE